jgi:uncharacterized tellurite resistance protein B-like protein
MNFTHFITHHGKRVNTEHYLHLVRVAKIDGKIKESELELLHKEGRRFGLTDSEIDQLIQSEASNNYHPPYSLKDKFEELYNITAMILADEVVTESEKRMIRHYAIVAGFSDDMIEPLLKLLLEGVLKGVDEEKLLKEFKKKYLSS